MKKRSINKATGITVKPLVLYHAKPYVMFWLLLNVAVSFYVFFTAYLVGVALITVPLALLLMLPIAPFFFGAFIGQVRALLWDGPALIIDDNGITDHREHSKFVAWDDIEKIYLSRRRLRLVLCIDFRDAAKIREHLPRPRLLVQLHNKANFEGDWNLPLGPLRCKSKEVLHVAREYHRRSKREQFQKAIGLNSSE